MNEHSDRRSTALTGMPRSRAAAATACATASSSAATMTSFMPSRSSSRNARRCHVTPASPAQLAQHRCEGGRNDDEPRAGAQQQPGLGLRRVRTADEQAGLAPDGEEDRQVVHGTAYLAMDTETGREFERPDRVRSSVVQGAANRHCESISPGRWAQSPCRNWRTLAMRHRDRLVIATSRAAWQARADGADVPVAVRRRECR